MFTFSQRAAKPSSSALQSMATLLQQVPALQAMAAEQEAQRRAAALQARRRAIAAYREAIAAVDATKADEEKAEAALAKLRQSLEEKTRDLVKASEEARSAQRRMSAIAKKLMLHHGEGEIERAKYTLQLVRERLVRKIDALEANRFIVSAAMFRRERPEIVAQIDTATQQLQAVAQGEQAIAAMPLTEDMDPEEIIERVQSILQRAGCHSPRDAYELDQAVEA